MINKVVLHEILKNKLPFVDTMRLLAIEDDIYEQTPHLGQTVYAIVKVYSKEHSVDLYKTIPCKITSMRLNKDGSSSFSVEGYYTNIDGYSNTVFNYYQANFKQSSIGRSVFIGLTAETDADAWAYKKNQKILTKINKT